MRFWKTKNGKVRSDPLFQSWGYELEIDLKGLGATWGVEMFRKVIAAVTRSILIKLYT